MSTKSINDYRKRKQRKSSEQFEEKEELEIVFFSSDMTTKYVRSNNHEVSKSMLNRV